MANTNTDATPTAATSRVIDRAAFQQAAARLPVPTLSTRQIALRFSAPHFRNAAAVATATATAADDVDGTPMARHHSVRTRASQAARTRPTTRHPTTPSGPGATTTRTTTTRHRDKPGGTGTSSDGETRTRTGEDGPAASARVPGVPCVPPAELCARIWLRSRYHACTTAALRRLIRARRGRRSTAPPLGRRSLRPSAPQPGDHGSP